MFILIDRYEIEGCGVEMDSGDGSEVGPVEGEGGEWKGSGERE